MKHFTKRTEKIAGELNDLYLKTQDFTEASEVIRKKYGESELSKALSYMDYLKSEEYELGIF